MCVWTKKRGSMNAVVLMATPCPESLHGKGEKWIARSGFGALFLIFFRFLRQSMGGERGGSLVEGRRTKHSLKRAGRVWRLAHARCEF